MNTKEATERDAKILIEDTVMRSQYAKTEMCKMEPMSDNPAMMLIAVESDETNPEHDSCVEFQQENGLSKPYHIAMIPLVHKEDVVDCIDDVVRAMPIAKFDFIILAVEGYTRKFESDESREQAMNMEKGALEKEFRENPFTDVREAHVITAINWEGDTLWHTVTPYTYDDSGVPVWSETQADVNELTDDSDFGRIPNTLMAVVKFMRISLATSEYSDLLRKAKKEGR